MLKRQVKWGKCGLIIRHICGTSPLLHANSGNTILPKSWLSKKGMSWPSPQTYPMHHAVFWFFSHPSALQTREKLISHPQLLETKVPIFLTRELAGVLNRDCLSFPPIRNRSHLFLSLLSVSTPSLCLGYRSLLYCWRSRRLNRKAYTGF